MKRQITITRFSRETENRRVCIPGLGNIPFNETDAARVITHDLLEHFSEFEIDFKDMRWTDEVVARGAMGCYRRKEFLPSGFFKISYDPENHKKVKKSLESFSKTEQYPIFSKHSLEEVCEAFDYEIDAEWLKVEWHKSFAPFHVTFEQLFISGFSRIIDRHGSVESAKEFWLKTHGDVKEILQRSGEKSLCIELEI